MPGGPSYHNNLDSIPCTQELARKIPSPVKLAAEDPPLAKFFGDERIMNPRIYVGGCLFDIVEGNPQLLVVLLTTFKYSHYFVVPSSGIIHVILHQVWGVWTGRDGGRGGIVVQAVRVVTQL